MGERETGDILHGRQISCTDSQTTWKLICKISEKTCQIHYPLLFESVTVFICEQVSLDKDVGQKAVVKVGTECVLSRTTSRSFDSDDETLLLSANISRNPCHGTLDSCSLG